MSRIRSRRTGSSTSTNRQGWLLPTEGARHARPSSSPKMTGSIGWRRKRRTSRRQASSSRNCRRKSSLNFGGCMLMASCVKAVYALRHLLCLAIASPSLVRALQRRADARISIRGNGNLRRTSARRYLSHQQWWPQRDSNPCMSHEHVFAQNDGTLRWVETRSVFDLEAVAGSFDKEPVDTPRRFHGPHTARHQGSDRRER